MDYELLYNIWYGIITFYLLKETTKTDYDLEFLMIHSQYD